ncbi:ABC-type transport auxiliary lipoprotein family protein [Aliidiomarina sanyensis]|uniref:ABC-type transport auxiliary lipoprotein component domain-containing protein n=1 Tax=Aliidiomarina sanyensis TaxID=1249555 RepID=A0A432WSB5_9GAMM|nr:ABC-type transport auxiliary lipoprotein family protein [Aliidiomarina sanyensis]RUO36644.1 hypothetical protein CWE11_02195 [Aliidiomarina sanyensis]
MITIPHLRGFVTALLGCTLLVGCTVIPKAESVTSYRLTPASVSEPAQSDEIVRSIRIQRPNASDLLTGDRILRVEQDGSYAAYAGVRWNNTLPILWRDWLLDSLWRDARFAEVTADVDQARVRHVVTGTLRAMHIEQGYAVVRYDVQLMRHDTRAITSEQSFSARVPLEASGASNATRALGNAANQVNAEVRDWLHREILAL